MAAAGALTSDHINYMILRYLQETGHERTALAFWRDWHRSPEHRDPESLPFVPSIQRNELVTVIQHGLEYDSLRAQAQRNGRRFRWIDPQDGAQRPTAIVENGDGSRPTSSSKRRDRLSSGRSNPEFAPPPPKRQRRSEGSEVHVNGDQDAMDVDPTPPYAEADDDNGSATMASEPEVNELVERYDSMDVATQTDVQVGPKTDTLYWKVEKPKAAILHSAWEPGLGTSNIRTLLTVGEFLCRFYKIPDSTSDHREISHVDEPSVFDDFYVSATAWRPDSLGVACAISGTANSLGGKASVHTLGEYSKEGNGVVTELKSPLPGASGIVLSLQYSPDGAYLLAARTSLKRGWVQVWKTARTDSEARPPFLEPIAWRLFDSQVHDVAWTQPDTFLVCGENGLSELCAVTAQPQEKGNTDDATDIRTRGLVSRRTNMLGTDDTWDKVRFDHRHKVAAFASISARKLCFATESPGADRVDLHSVDLPGDLTELAFQPYQESANESRSLLAATFSNCGKCVIYGVEARPDLGRPVYHQLAALSLSDEPALALAWSPSGEHIAVGNADLVQIWRTAILDKRRPVCDALVTWRLASEVDEARNGLAHTRHNEPSLSWSANGESLVFAVDNQVAVIRFRPPLHSDPQDASSHASP